MSAVVQTHVNVTQIQIKDIVKTSEDRVEDKTRRHAGEHGQIT